MLLLEKAPAGAVARRRRIPERPQIKSPIFFRFRRIAAFEPRLPKSADCQAIAVGKERERKKEALSRARSMFMTG
jgi:hypothetical protein